MAGSMVGGGVRVLRLAAFSVTATVLALGAHVLGGGAPPPLAASAAAILLPALAAVVLSRRRRGLLEITVVLGAVQLVLHELFSALTQGHQVQVMAGHPGTAGWMPFTHAAAVVLTAALLARGERTLHLLQTWWRAVPEVTRGLPAPAVQPPPPPAVQPRARPVRELPSYRASAPVVRRGPPLPVC